MLVQEGYSPLIVASCVGNTEIVDLLLQYDAVVNDAAPVSHSVRLSSGPGQWDHDALFSPSDHCPQR